MQYCLIEANQSASCRSIAEGLRSGGTLFRPISHLTCELSSFTTDILSKDFSHWSHCQGHRYHCHVSSADSSGHTEGKYSNTENVIPVFCFSKIRLMKFNIFAMTENSVNRQKQLQIVSV